MRTIATIEKDINRCKAQIAATYNPDFANSKDSQITREGFQKQLKILNDEHKQSIFTRNITVVDSEIIKPNKA